jgi:hypothetical protein
MARNKPATDGHRGSAIRDRAQVKAKLTGVERLTKRSAKADEIMMPKQSGGKFKTVHREEKH